jgi:hypothetical protein
MLVSNPKFFHRRTFTSFPIPRKFECHSNHLEKKQRLKDIKKERKKERKREREEREGGG